MTLSFSDIANHPNLSLSPRDYIKPKVDNSKIIVALNKSAESLMKQSENINTEVSGNWTHRRQSFADSAQKKKDRLIKNAIALNRLADLWNKGEVPDILKGIRTAGDFDAYYPRPVELGDGDWYREEYPQRLKKALKVGLKMLSDNDTFKEAIKELSEIVLTPEQIKAKELKEELKKVHTFNIPGFFPTPDELIDVMLDYADIGEADTIFEPSAGIGSIIDRMLFRRGYPFSPFQVSCSELNHSLAHILMLKGYNVISNDFHDAIGLENGFDRIIMNPPFEKGQDMEHVMECWSKFLKDGGKLVSIMSNSVKSHTGSKYVQFREWVELHNGYFIDNGQAFKNAFNSTGVHTSILILEKHE